MKNRLIIKKSLVFIAALASTMAATAQVKDSAALPSLSATPPEVVRPDNLSAVGVLEKNTYNISDPSHSSQAIMSMLLGGSGDYSPMANQYFGTSNTVTMNIVSTQNVGAVSSACGTNGINGPTSVISLGYACGGGEFGQSGAGLPARPMGTNLRNAAAIGGAWEYNIQGGTPGSWVGGINPNGQVPQQNGPPIDATVGGVLCAGTIQMPNTCYGTYGGSCTGLVAPQPALTPVTATAYSACYSGFYFTR